MLENFSQFENLRGKEGVISFMKLSRNLKDWNIRCEKVRRANGGVFPVYWDETIINSGLMESIIDTWKN